MIVAAAQAGVGTFYSSPFANQACESKASDDETVVTTHYRPLPAVPYQYVYYLRLRYRWRPDSRFLSNTTTTGADFTTCWPHIFLVFLYYQLHLILSRMRTKHEKEDGLVLGKIDSSRHSPAGFGPDSSYVRIAQRSCYQSISKRLIIFSLYFTSYLLFFIKIILYT